MEELYENIISFLLFPSFSGWLFALKIVFIFITLFFIGSIIFFLIKSSWLNYIILYDVVEFLTYRPYGVRKIEKIWLKTKARLDTGLESEYKLAVIEADNMMDDILKRMGYGGETLGERLTKLTAATLSNIEQIKETHKMRNNIVHDPDYRLSSDEAKKFMAVYERAFRDLQAF